MLAAQSSCTRSKLLVLPLVACLVCLTGCGGGAPESSSSTDTGSDDVQTISTDNQSAAETSGGTTASDGEASGGLDIVEGSTGSTDTTSGTGTAAQPQLDPTPIVRAPTDVQIVITDTLTLAGSVSFEGKPVDIPVVQWSMESGPGNVVFEDASSANTTARFDTVGTYSLVLSASNGTHSATDRMQVAVVTSLTNRPPEVDAGADETIEIDEVLNLAASVVDDGLPNSTLSGAWTKVSGSGSVTFGEITNTDTTATFDATGSYVLQYSASDGELSAGDQMGVQVNNDSAPENNQPNINASNQWQTVNSSNGSKPQARHEAAAVEFQGKLYLMGGRGNRQVNRYDPNTNRWENLGTPGFEMSHFQPVVYGGKIYVLGALDCCYPSENVLGKIQIFNPANKTWSAGATIPNNRRRGSAGVVLRNNRIYIVGGSTNGHDGGMVNWFDEYNPANNSWKKLPDAPTKRDHFSAAVVGSKLVAAGGRATDYPNTFKNLVSAVDIYDFNTGKWSNGKAIPTKRAGAMTVSYGTEVILIGGETDRGSAAQKTVEAYNVVTNQWRALNPLKTARHSGGAAIVGNAIHVVSGNLTIGGGNESQAHEKLKLD